MLLRWYYGDFLYWMARSYFLKKILASLPTSYFSPPRLFITPHYHTIIITSNTTNKTLCKKRASSNFLSSSYKFRGDRLALHFPLPFDRLNWWMAIPTILFLSGIILPDISYIRFHHFIYSRPLISFLWATILDGIILSLKLALRNRSIWIFAFAISNDIGCHMAIDFDYRGYFHKGYFRFIFSTFSDIFEYHIFISIFRANTSLQLIHVIPYQGHAIQLTQARISQVSFSSFTISLFIGLIVLFRRYILTSLYLLPSIYCSLWNTLPHYFTSLSFLFRLVTTLPYSLTTSISIIRAQILIIW